MGTRDAEEEAPALVVALGSALARFAVRQASSSHPLLRPEVEAGDTDELVAVVGRHTPRLLLVSATLPGPHLHERLALIQREHQAAPLALVVRRDMEHTRLVDLLRLHPHAVVDSALEPDAIVEVLNLVLLGEYVHCEAGMAALRTLLTPSCHENTNLGASPLTERERLVLELLAHGLSEEAIAHQMGLATRTVHAYLSQIKTKLNATSRTHSVALAVGANLISTGRPS